MATIHLPASLFAALLLLTHEQVYASLYYSNSYISKFTHNLNSKAIYKTIDSSGRITYSSTLPDDSVQAEEVRIDAAPSEASIEDSRQRHEKISQYAQALTEARVQREQARAEREKQRLERLALLNQTRPPRVYQRNIFVAHPYKLWRTWPGGGRHHDKHPLTLPARRHTPSLMPLPRSSFPSMF